ncbi:unnamed protein product [Polarella glacialis]|uniref:Cytosol aminopeptidase domain-containing protein n=3 Tax=Polarella glacialis TaxID=89957 RepID=A0A813GWV3_POLGL|nr:unnamed protein product [Polarella glacialis]
MAIQAIHKVVMPSPVAVAAVRVPWPLALHRPLGGATPTLQQDAFKLRVPPSQVHNRERSSSLQLAGFGASLGIASLGMASRRQRRAGQPLLVLLRAAATASPPASMLFREHAGPSLQLTPTRADAWGGHSLVLFLRARADGEEGSPELGRIGEAIDKSLGGALKEFVAEEGFDAKAGSAKSLAVFNKDVKRVVLVGLGAGGKEDTDWRAAGAAAAGVLKSQKGGSAGLACIDGVQVQALTEGVLLGLHSDKRFQGTKSPDKEKSPAGPAVLELLGAFPPGSADAAERARAVASGVIFARELVNGPANIVDPPNLAAAAVDMAERLGLTAKVLDEAQCEELGMGSFLAVSKASNLGARLIHLTYSPGGEVKRKIGIVGKGLTFDSGGYNLKVGDGSMIELMKFDMGGAASTLGTAAVIAQLKPQDVEVHFIIATCENMVSGNIGALRPGDIITAMDGTTIEVNNTDAEGRLTLADAMLYCQNVAGAKEVVDIATLTGACMVALGKGIAGLWSNSDDLAGRLEAAGKATGEKLWRMPLEESYFEGLKSDFADMKNTGPRVGGAITAALFLQKFVHKETTWAHLDIAGPVWAEKPKGENGVGGTGTMVRTLTEFISRK